MFSTINPFAVVIGSYSAGINFIDGIVYRIILFIIACSITILYLYVYYRKILADETSSVVYKIKDEIEKKYIKKENSEEEFLKKERNTSKDINKDINTQEIKEDKYEVQIDEKLLGENKEKFTLKQKLSLIFFILGFAIMVLGILIFSWWFEHMSAVFLVTGIILMFFYSQGEKKAIECFVAMESYLIMNLLVDEKHL